MLVNVPLKNWPQEDEDTLVLSWDSFVMLLSASPT